jgi:Tol biopolymer transport system component
LGYRLISQRKSAESIAVLKMNIKAFPDSWNVYDSMGEIYTWTNDTEKARVNFKKSLELNPANENAIKNISEINGFILDHKNETKSDFNYKCGESTGINKTYFGEEPPGLKAKLFAPGIISTQGHFELSVTFTPDGKELYFTRRADEGGVNVIMVCKWEENGWTAPDTANFSKEGRSSEPHITPDGSKLYFGTTRIKPGEEKPSYGIWVMNRLDNHWGKPEYAMYGMYVSTTYDGSIYFTDISDQSDGGIKKITSENGGLQKREKLGSGVNDPTNGVHPFISPKEDFIIFDGYRKEGFGGEGDLYVAYKDENGKWSDAYNLGVFINGPGTNFCASISPDGKYIFYTKNRDIYWVSTKIIEELKPKGIK